MVTPVLHFAGLAKKAKFSSFIILVP
jgi:hypothetical protein